MVDTPKHLEQIEPREQDHSHATIAPKLSKPEGTLDWNMDAREIDRRVRGLQPWPGATLPTSRGRAKALKRHLDGDRYVPDVVPLPVTKPATAEQELVSA